MGMTQLSRGLLVLVEEANGSPARDTLQEFARLIAPLSPLDRHASALLVILTQGIGDLPLNEHGHELADRSAVVLVVDLGDDAAHSFGLCVGETRPEPVAAHHKAHSPHARAGRFGTPGPGKIIDETLAPLGPPTRWT